MSKKTYHIVDPETGEIIEKRYVGGLGKLLYQMVATGWSKRLRWAFRIAVFLCVVLTIAESVLRESLPVLYDSTDGIVLLGDLLALREVILAIRRFFRKKTQKEVEKAEKLYQIVDPETGEVVGTRRVGDEKNPYDTTTSSYKFARAIYYRFTVPCSFLALLSGAALFLVPDDWQPRVGMTAAIFCALIFISNFIWRYNLYEKKDTKIDKFERAMARFTLVCYLFAVLFGLATCFVSGNWISRAATVSAIFLILACISDRIWFHEQIDGESSGEKEQ